MLGSQTQQKETRSLPAVQTGGTQMESFQGRKLTSRQKSPEGKRMME